MRGNVSRCRWLAAAIAALFALAAIGASLTWSKIFDSVLASQLELVPGSRSYREWLAPSVPLRFDIYLFNWTNFDKFPEEAPNVQELGPYSFHEERYRTNVTYHPHNDSISYRIFRSYQFDAEASKANLDDYVISINPLATSAIHKNRFESYLKQKTLAMTLSLFGQQYFIKKTARELLFDGYEDLMLDVAKSLPPSATGGAPRIDRFGWFSLRNNSIDSEGHLVVSAGVTSGTLPGQILRWNFLDNMPFYENECSELSGSVGEYFPRSLSPSRPPRVFLPELCRAVRLRHVAGGQDRGLHYLTYAVTAESFDKDSSSSSCFCPSAADCSWSGVMNVSSCRYGSPTVVSLPHFLHADERLGQAVTGLSPDPDKHSFYFSIEPKLGIPLDVAARFQLNIYIEPNPYVSMFEKSPKLLFPVLWVQQQVKVDDIVVAELKFVRAILDWGAIFCAVVALCLAAIVAVATCSNLCLNKPKYIAPADIIYEKPKDEAELKLNPM